MVSEQNSSGGVRARHWGRLSLRAQGIGVLAFPMAVLFVTLFAIYWAEGSVHGAEETVGRAYDTRGEIVQLRSALSDADTALSGYLATGQPAFRAAYRAARREIAASLEALPRIAGNSASPGSEISEIELLGTQELAALDSRVAGHAATAGPLNELQTRLGLLADEEERRFTEARHQRDLARQTLFRTVIACGILGPMGALFIHLLVAGRLVKRIEFVTENARRLAHSLPLDPFPKGADEVAVLARQIEDAAFLLQARERELRGSEMRYRDLFDQAPVPFEETDREGAVTRFNQAVCTLLRCSPQRLLGCYAWDFIAAGEEQDAFRTAMLERIATGRQAGPFETDFMLDDGSHLDVEIRESFIYDEGGQVAGLCLSLLDVTERNLAAVAARKVEQYALELRNKNEQLGRALSAAHSATEAKSRFLASISHELRTPLNGIIGFSELMHDGRLGEITADQRDVMSDILNSARHLLQLINDILDLSKVEAGKMDFRPEDCDLVALVSEVTDVIRPLAEKKSLDLSASVPFGMHAVIDGARFKQVLYNYVSNAVKFTPEGGRVSIRVAEQSDSRFLLEVEDTGIGIPEAEVRRLFQEFQQLPSNRKAEQGTGLGLALTRAIVEAQGGSVGVRSQPGQGSIFSAVLPLQTIVGPIIPAGTT